MRIVSRTARILLEKHRAIQRQRGGRSSDSGAVPISAPKPRDETPWPKSLRYAFYAACVASVPFSIGQAIAASPRLRDWLSGDEEDVTEGDGQRSVSTGEIVSLVRSYWGHEDYVPPVDRPRLEHAVPGHRHGWKEDNYSSLLHIFGLYAPNPKEIMDVSSGKLSEDQIPMSFDNEPSFAVRNDQMVLAQYLSTKSNTSGVKTRLSLIPCALNANEEGNYGDDAAYETECTLPANTPIKSLRDFCHGSESQSLKMKLAKSDPEFHSIPSSERIRTKSWNDKCRWVLSFPDLDDDSASGIDVLVQGEGHVPIETSDESPQSPSGDSSEVLRKITSIHSSWSHFPELANGNTPTASPVGSNAADSPRGSTSTASPSISSTSTESLLVQRLQYQIEMLEQELEDPSSLRDRDSMFEELRLAKRELRSLKPWWRRFW